MAAQVAEWGIENYCRYAVHERWWGMEIAPDARRIEPDETCAAEGLTLPEEPLLRADVDTLPLHSVHAIYLGWVVDFWNNTTHHVLCDRLTETLASLDQVTGAEIAAFLDALAATLGPGGALAPI